MVTCHPRVGFDPTSLAVDGTSFRRADA
jgi:hypothetical protein